MGQNKYKRKQPNRIVKDTVYIVCGGETERIYFENFRKKFHTQFSERKIRIVKSYHDPLRIINTCITLKEQEKNALKIWAVFDKDDFQNFDEAICLARQNKIHCAFSNQAFEVWLIHHFCGLERALHRDKYANKIKKLTGKDYIKSSKELNKMIDTMLELPIIQTAMSNAQKSFLYHEEMEYAGKYSNYESCTTVYQLIKDFIPV